MRKGLEMFRSMCTGYFDEFKKRKHEDDDDETNSFDVTLADPRVRRSTNRIKNRKLKRSKLVCGRICNSVQRAV